MRAAIREDEITVLIPSNGRPESLRGCLQSVRENVGNATPIVVLDSTPDSAPRRTRTGYERVAAAFDRVKYIRTGYSVGPAEARKRLVGVSDTPYVLFMDDDHQVLPGTLDALARALVGGAFDIVGGRWLDRKIERPVGFLHMEAPSESGTDLVKVPVRYSEDLEGRVLPVDEVLATMLCRRSIFSNVDFDPQYDFYFELFDFFRSCRTTGLQIGAVVDAVFVHHPRKYRSVSTRQTQVRSVDHARFATKWNVRPVSLPL